MKKKTVVILAFMQVLVLLAPNITASNTTTAYNKEEMSGKNESAAFIIGMMMLKIEKVSWGFMYYYTPLCILIMDSTEGSYVLGPLSGTLDLHKRGFDGYLGPMHHVYEKRFDLTFRTIQGPFFICGRLG